MESILEDMNNGWKKGRLEGGGEGAAQGVGDKYKVNDGGGDAEIDT
jgi:hypothetical protein